MEQKREHVVRIKPTFVYRNLENVFCMVMIQSKNFQIEKEATFSQEIPQFLLRVTKFNGYIFN